MPKTTQSRQYNYNIIIMKKVLLVAGILGALAFSSCTKEKTCVCTDISSDPFFPTTTQKTDKACSSLHVTALDSIACVEK